MSGWARRPPAVDQLDGRRDIDPAGDAVPLVASLAPRYMSRACAGLGDTVNTEACAWRSAAAFELGVVGLEAVPEVDASASPPARSSPTRDEADVPLRQKPLERGGSSTVS